MNFLSDYYKQRSLSVHIWKSSSRGIAFWVGWVVTWFEWTRGKSLDEAAMQGLQYGLLTLLAVHFIVNTIGTTIVDRNIWNYCGCGCLLGLGLSEVPQYFAVFYIFISAVNKGQLQFWGAVGGASIIVLILFALNYMYIGRE